MLAGEPGAPEAAAPLALVSADCAATAPSGAPPPAPSVAAARQALGALQQGYAARTAAGGSLRVRLPRPQPGCPGDATGILTRWPPLPPPHLRCGSPRASPRKAGNGAPPELPTQPSSAALARVTVRQAAFARDGRAGAAKAAPAPPRGSPERASPLRRRGGAAGASVPAGRQLPAGGTVAVGALSSKDRQERSAALPPSAPSPLGPHPPSGSGVSCAGLRAAHPHPVPGCVAAAPGQPCAANAEAGAPPAAPRMSSGPAAVQARRRRWAWLRSLFCLGRRGSEPGDPVDTGRQPSQAGSSPLRRAAPSPALGADPLAQAGAGARRAAGIGAFEGCGARSAGCSCALGNALHATSSAPGHGQPSMSNGRRGAARGARGPTAPAAGLSRSPQDAGAQRLFVGPRSDDVPGPVPCGVAAAELAGRDEAPSSQDAHGRRLAGGRRADPAPGPAACRAAATGLRGGMGLGGAGVRHTAVTLVELLVRAVRSPSRGAADLRACQARCAPPPVNGMPACRQAFTAVVSAGWG